MKTIHDQIWSGEPLPAHALLERERPGDAVRNAVYAAARAAVPAAPARTLRLPSWRVWSGYAAWAAAAAVLLLVCVQSGTPMPAVPHTERLAQALVLEWRDTPLAEEYGMDEDDLERESVSTILAWFETDMAFDTFQVSYNN